MAKMTITLEDVDMILGVHLSGPPIIDYVVVGADRRWQSWSDYCDDMLGQHPIDDVVYNDTIDPSIMSIIKTVQAYVKTYVPLRWLR